MTSELLDAFSNNVGRIYEACIDPDTWPYALEALCEALNASKAQLLYMHPEDLTFSFASGFGFDPYMYDIGASKFRRYLMQDPVALYALEHENQVFSDKCVVDQEAFRQSPMQTDIRDPADMENLLTVYLTEDQIDCTVLVFFRGKNEQPFGDAEQKLLETYIPHIKRATRIHKTMAGTKQLESLQAAILNHFNSGMLIVDEDKKLLLANDSAHKILENCDNLHIRNKRLVCLKKSESEKINQSLAMALDSRSRDNELRKIAVKITGHKSGHPILAVTTPLCLQKLEIKKENLPLGKSHYTSKLPNRRYALITLCGPDRDFVNWAEMMQELFDLTPAEAALADKLADDCSIQQAAEMLGRSVGTARIQLQSIFEKTDTNRQSSLIRLLMSIPGQ